MTQSLSQNQVVQLQKCLSLSRDVSRHTEAEQLFEELRHSVAADNPAAVELLDPLWQEVLAARRSANFWQEISNVEKELSSRMAATHMQLRQNYLRLMQEQ
jgi:hypothetical protein